MTLRAVHTKPATPEHADTRPTAHSDRWNHEVPLHIQRIVPDGQGGMAWSDRSSPQRGTRKGTHARWPLISSRWRTAVGGNSVHNRGSEHGPGKTHTDHVLPAARTSTSTTTEELVISRASHSRGVFGQFQYPTPHVSADPSAPTIVR